MRTLFDKCREMWFYTLNGGGFICSSVLRRSSKKLVRRVFYGRCENHGKRRRRGRHRKAQHLAQAFRFRHLSRRRRNAAERGHCVLSVRLRSEPDLHHHRFLSDRLYDGCDRLRCVGGRAAHAVCANLRRIERPDHGLHRRQNAHPVGQVPSLCRGTPTTPAALRQCPSCT